MNGTSDKPITEVRLGNIKATVWRNDVENGWAYSIAFERLYKGEDGKWASSKYFGLDDLLLLAKVADHTHTSIHTTKWMDFTKLR